MIGKDNGDQEDVILDVEQADAVFVDAPQPTEEPMISLYRTYRSVGGSALKEYEDRLSELDDDEGAAEQSRAA
jgi:hypothetical protein